MPALAETSFPVAPDTVARALEWLEYIGHASQWPARTLFKLSLCLDETVTNIAMYGYPGGESAGGAPRVQLELHQDDRRLVLAVLDNGVAFDPTARMPRELDSSLDDARIGGHGLRLMQHYLEDIRYERREGWNRLELVAALDDA